MRSMSLKHDVIAGLETLPERATMLDIQYRLYVIEKVRKGEESLKKHGGIPHEQVKKKLAKWLTK